VPEKEVRELVAAASRVALNNGKLIEIRMSQSSDHLLEWLNFLESDKTGTADAMLDGVRAGIAEATSSLILALVRPCMFSMRAQIDMLFSWIYFKDHRIEWDKVDTSLEDFILPSVVLKYLNKYSTNFTDSMKLLTKHKTRLCEPYSLLSEHVHSQSLSAIPAVTKLAAVVQPDFIDDCFKLQADVSEYLSDVLLSWKLDRWTSLPEAIVKSVSTRLGDDLPALF